jgi:hypothetical protein
METIVLESAKGVKGGKVQLTFSQMVQTGNTSTNILGLLNASDDRFNQSKPRYAWLSGQPSDIASQFGISASALDALTEGAELELDMVDPRLMSNPEVQLNLQIVETTEGTTYDVANFATRAKRAGKDGDFITTADGQYIYVKTSVVAGPAQHKLIANTKRVQTTATLSDLLA